MSTYVVADVTGVFGINLVKLWAYRFLRFFGYFDLCQFWQVMLRCMCFYYTH